MSMTRGKVPKIVIVGGGISGLATAYRLLEQSHALQFSIDVHLLEADGRLGGVIQTAEQDGFLLEGGPDSFISEKPWGLALCRRIGLSACLIGTGETHRRSFIVSQGKLLPIPEGFYLLAPTQVWPFISTPIFSWAGKLRMAAELFLPRNNAGTVDSDESLADFVRRRLGREALERVAQPLVSGIYTANPDELSVRATMPRFLEMEQQYRSIILGMLWQRRKMRKIQKAHASGPRYGLFVSLDRGMETLVRCLESKIPQQSIHLAARVNFLEWQPTENKWILRLQDNSIMQADAVCLALAAFESARLVETLDLELAGKLRTIPYASTATVNLAYRREDIPHPLDGFGFVVPFIEGRQLLACTFSHIKFDGRAPQDFALLRAFMGGALQPDAFDLDDREMVRVIRQNLNELLGIEKEPIFTRIERHPRSMAQYRVGHLSLVKGIEERLAPRPTLQIAGNGISGIGIPDCIHRGETCADRILRTCCKGAGP
jgi:oxygen-dependent protoporphyrinogen oxidase